MERPTYCHCAVDCLRDVSELSRQLVLTKARLARARAEITVHTTSKFWALTSPLRALLRWLGLDKAPSRKVRRELELLRNSGLFDEVFYILRYPDVAESGEDPILHYLETGSAEGRNPSNSFDTRKYLELNPDVACHPSGINPLVHYIKFGKAEGRLCS